jgi:hypothetical protein
VDETNLESAKKRATRAALTISIRAVVAAGLATAACQGPDPYIRGPSLITCTISRQECTTYDTATKTCPTVSNDLERPFQADICYDANADTRRPDDICKEKFCTEGPDAPGVCLASGLAVTGTLALCQPFDSGLGVITTVNWTVHGEQCLFANGSLCTMALKNESHTACELINNETPLETFKAPPMEWISRAVHVDPIDVNRTCTRPGPFMRAQFAGPIASASGGGTSASITAVRGLASVGASCGSDGCFPASLDTFDAALGDLTVAGTPLTNTSVSLTQSAPLTDMVDDNGNGFLGIETDAFELRVTGKKGGVDSYYSARNKTPWRLDTSTTTFHLTGTLGIVDRAADGSPLPVVITADVSGVPATAQTIACADASALSRVFGFEDPMSWSSTASPATLSLVTSPITQGCAALGLRGQGFMPIDSMPFSTRNLTTNAAASVDLFIPGKQPNQFWQGQLQMYLSCPSGNFFHQYVGQADLTGKPQNQFSTLRIPLTSAARTVLGQTHDDCSIQLALNVNPTNSTWVFDNFRFTP